MTKGNIYNRYCICRLTIWKIRKAQRMHYNEARFVRQYEYGVLEGVYIAAFGGGSAGDVLILLSLASKTSVDLMSSRGL